MSTVHVNVFDAQGRPTDGTVAFHRTGPTVYRCSTVAGRCQVRGVPAGTYRVTLHPRRGTPTARMLTVRRGQTLRVTLRAGAAPRTVTRGAALQREVSRLRIENAILRARLRRCR
jgi:hypothetical protein